MPGLREVGLRMGLIILWIGKGRGSAGWKVEEFGFLKRTLLVFIC
jgi:hypothetical protein